MQHSKHHLYCHILVLLANHTVQVLASDQSLHSRNATCTNAPTRYRSIEQVAVESLRAPIAAAELVSLIFFELHELLRRAVDAETAAKRCGVLTDQRERHRGTEQSELDALRLQVEQLKWSVQSVTEEVTAQCTAAAAAAHDAQNAQQQQVANSLFRACNGQALSLSSAEMPHAAVH
jgi:hypothetical protein